MQMKMVPKYKDYRNISILLLKPFMSLSSLLAMVILQNLGATLGSGDKIHQGSHLFARGRGLVSFYSKGL